MPVSILDDLVSLCFIELMSEGLNLLLVLCADRLQLLLDSFIKLFFISFYFSGHECLIPSLKHISHLLNTVRPLSVLENIGSVFLELPIVFDCFETIHLDDFHASHCLPLTRPQSHYFTSE